MTKRKSTKRALLASALSMLLCLAMLIGATFAWFTDSVTSGINKITAGNLDVELEYAEFDAETGAITWVPVDVTKSLFKSADGDGATLWEPGHTEYVCLRVRNAGTLALKYHFTVNAYGNEKGAPENTYTSTVKEGEEYKKFKLSDYLVFNQIDGKAEKVNDRKDLWLTDADAEKAAMGQAHLEDLNKDDVLMPAGKGTSEQILTLAVYMPTWVDNHANQLTSARTKETDPETAPTIYLGLNLDAYQTPYENDSFGNNYDLTADPEYYAKADAEALANNPKNAFRSSDGRYWSYGSASSERKLLPYLLKNNMDATLIRDIGEPATSASGGQTDYNGQNTVLDLNSHTYTLGMLELRQTYNTEVQDSSLVLKNGTMLGTINFEDILVSYNAMKSVTLDHVNLKWDNPRAWDYDKANYHGLNLAADVAGTTFTVQDSVLDCNAQFHTTDNFPNPDDRPVVNVTNTTVNGRLSGSSVNMTVSGCIVNGEVYCNGSWSSATTVDINNSTINGNAYFDASSSQSNDVKITDTTITGNLQTNYSRNNVRITLTNVTVKGNLSYSGGLSSKVSSTLVTIVSGTYGFDPTNYLADGSIAEFDSATGLWVVTAG